MKATSRNSRVEPSDLISRFFRERAKAKRDDLAQVILSCSDAVGYGLELDSCKTLASLVQTTVTARINDNVYGLRCSLSLHGDQNVYAIIGRGSKATEFLTAVNKAIENFELGEYDKPLAPTPCRGVLMGKEELVAQILDSISCLGTIESTDGFKMMVTLGGQIEWPS